MSENKELINFPEKFPIKIFGLNNLRLEEEVKLVIEKYVENKDILDWNINKSSKSKYIAITITIMAISQKQLDDIYTETNKLECVKMML